MKIRIFLKKYKKFYLLNEKFSSASGEAKTTDKEIATRATSEISGTDKRKTRATSEISGTDKRKAAAYLAKDFISTAQTIDKATVCDDGAVKTDTVKNG